MNEFPDIEIEYSDQRNPTITSPSAPFPLQFYQTEDSLRDVEVYKNFLNNAISQFRKMVFYKNYKGHLMSMGLDHCQIMPNVTEENVGSKGIEMNHNFLTIFDIALMITEHVIHTIGYISTFDLIHLLRIEHEEHRIPIVMLSQTVHELHHAYDDFVLPAQMCFGDWIGLLQKYNRGITPHIANKVVKYIDRSINEMDLTAGTITSILELKENIEGWSKYNEYADSYSLNSHNNSIGSYPYYYGYIPDQQQGY